MESCSCDISDYNLPVKDAESLKNFKSLSISVPYSLSEIVMGDTSGSTETDSKTAPKSGNYSKINQK